MIFLIFFEKKLKYFSKRPIYITEQRNNILTIKIITIDDKFHVYQSRVICNDTSVIHPGSIDRVYLETNDYSNAQKELSSVFLVEPVRTGGIGRGIP